MICRAAGREIYERGSIGARPRPLWWELARIRLRGTVPSLRRARRAVAAVTFAASASTVIGMLAVPVLIQLLVIPRLRWRWYIACGAVRLLAGLTGRVISVHNLDRLPQEPAIVVANHSSWLDGLSLLACRGDAVLVPLSCR
ncbi:hypothetical protein CRI77_09050 [Mycolicibacterium duvalii]|uniref:Uncharacterized protein n=1 Tax=Mycolicibacterium duvalii TaxID=39688 RepID=A0A7I7JWT5_9MYCO|nr:1-acyl-sn-glycerol-3-phosphate acyltransferase [Mycolicibacterium duvalii]MCV7369552.1 1-acyl-sn-glycerol-3-phosphate acyltransferase [Mycolicibacterium duvalii]PEG42179.1 hypothetical protein CRI77_09050 [Mycolicibacterium duvalii]BBX16275.1 hypothetical protein MDUV_11350 [Mycolicibacterium duvalii]